MIDRLAGWSPYGQAALRLMAALLFLAHGVQKFFGFPEPSERGTVQLLSFMGLAATLELAGLLLLVGLFTRPIALLLSGMMAVAYFMAHAPRSVFPILNGGEPAILFCFIFLFLSMAGPGALSLDAARGRRL